MDTFRTLFFTTMFNVFYFFFLFYYILFSVDGSFLSGKKILGVGLTETRRGFPSGSNL